VFRIFKEFGSFITILLLTSSFSFAGVVRGRVFDQEGKNLPFASILINGKGKGITANGEGFFEIELSPGKYRIACQYVGYATLEKWVQVAQDPIVVDFVLEKQTLVLPDVIISNKENPANRLIREVIKRQTENQQNAEDFSCQVYSKGQLRLRDFPSKFLAQKVDFEDGDSSKKKIIYLSETVSDFSQQNPKQKKVVVRSSRVSGNSDGFGLAVPDQYSLYENLVLEGTRLNPRGFVSPLASNAFSFYSFKLLGTYTEKDKLISQIRVTPKRTGEPLFEGEISIVQEDWQLHSLSLLLTKKQQLELVDTIKLVQLYEEVERGRWIMTSQVLYPAAKKFGFDAYGSFINVYTSYQLKPLRTKKFFGQFLLEYTDSANRRAIDYWETIRPIPLTLEEQVDYRKKDSLEQKRKDPRYIDSLNRIRNKFTVPKLVLAGQTLFSKGNSFSISVNPLLEQLAFTPAEGLVLQPVFRWQSRLDSVGPRRALNGALTIRAGFLNKHLNPYLITNYLLGTKWRSTLSLGVGKQVLSFNGQNPISDRSNTLACLLLEENRIRSYEAAVLKFSYNKALGAGASVGLVIRYEDRRALDNRTTYAWIDKKNRAYTPNFPFEISPVNILPHQLFEYSLSFRWQPGTRYVKLPERIINVGSDKPVFTFQYTQSIAGIGGSDASFSKWRFGVTDSYGLGLGGQLRIRFAMGGFLNRDSVPLADYIHFNGNISTLSGEYLNSFQLLSLYQLSHREKWYGLGHVEYNLKGLLTNKVPLLKKLKTYLVLGANACYVTKDRNHLEWFVGLDNLFKQFRVDYVRASQPGGVTLTGVRIGLKIL
jgi:hypothetical protein